MGRLALLTAAAWLAALAVPAEARDPTVNVGGFRYSPETVTIHPGDKVTWSWVGPDRNHTVTSDPGQAESFESHPGLPAASVTDGPPGETFGHTFRRAGTFGYFCRVHPYIRGEVTVVAPGARRPDTTPPTTKLRVLSSSLRSVVRRGRLRVRVTVDEKAKVRLTVKAAGRTIATKTVTFGAAGTRTVTLKLTRAGRRRLAGRTRVRVTVVARARDSAGNVRTERKSSTLRSGTRRTGSPPPIRY